MNGFRSDQRHPIGPDWMTERDRLIAVDQVVQVAARHSALIHAAGDAGSQALEDILKAVHYADPERSDTAVKTAGQCLAAAYRAWLGLRWLEWRHQMTSRPEGSRTCHGTACRCNWPLPGMTL